jgi:riboflavin kinase/FMN adenylyltransferase
MEFSGIVQKGFGTGAAFGFPTANIPLTDTTVSGIYAATVVLDGKEYRAATYADQKRGLLESHLLDFSGDLYGKELSVTLHEKVREDKVFDTVEALVAQIAADVAKVRQSRGTI